MSTPFTDSNTWQLEVQISWRLSKVRTRPASRKGDFAGIFLQFSLKAHNYYPAYHIGLDFSNWKSRHYGILIMKTFYDVANAIICCAKEARASIVLDIKWAQFVLQNREKLQNYRFQ